MNEKMSRLDFWGIVDVFAGQYLLYLAYQIYSNQGTASSLGLTWIATVMFILGGVGAVALGIYRLVKTYKSSKLEEKDSSAEES